MAYSSAETISLSVFLANLSSEADRLAQVAEQLDNALGELAATDVVLAQSLAAEFQNVDALRQALHALGRITSSASSEVVEAERVELSKAVLAAGVKLERVRDACLQTSEQPAGLPTTSQNKPSQSAAAFFEEF